MPASRVVRIDDEVWAELQKRATPLQDTPNSVMRRVFGLPEDKDNDPSNMDSRVKTLLGFVEELVGQVPQVHLGDQGYSFLSMKGNAVAHIRCRSGLLRIVAGKPAAERAGLNDWEDELKRRGPFGGPSVRWYVSDGDTAANRRVATVLATLWNDDMAREVVPLGADSAAAARAGHIQDISLTSGE